MVRGRGGNRVGETPRIGAQDEGSDCGACGVGEVALGKEAVKTGGRVDETEEMGEREGERRMEGGWCGRRK